MDDETNFRLISCCSKQAVETSCHSVLSSVFQHIDKSDYSDEFREGLKVRFKEVYENAIHDNVSVEGQTWSQAIEEGNTTKDYEPVNTELKKDISAKALQLDELLVSTMRKRTAMPPKISHEVTKRMKHLRHAVEKFTPTLNKPDVETNPLPTQVLEKESKQLQAAGDAVSSLSRNLPLLENKASRLLEARELKSSMQDNDVYKIISRPLTDESKMATSMTPLRHRLANETPTQIIRPTPQYSMRALKLQNHPINNTFKLSSAEKPHETEEHN